MSRCSLSYQNSLTEFDLTVLMTWRTSPPSPSGLSEGTFYLGIPRSWVRLFAGLKEDLHEFLRSFVSLFLCFVLGLKISGVNLFICHLIVEMHTVYSTCNTFCVSWKGKTMIWVQVYFLVLLWKVRPTTFRHNVPPFTPIFHEENLIYIVIFVFQTSHLVR